MPEPGRDIHEIPMLRTRHPIHHDEKRGCWCRPVLYEYPDGTVYVRHNDEEPTVPTTNQASRELRDEIPGWEGTVGPFPAQYSKPHVYARDIHSGAGNCVCGHDLGHSRHVQAAPGVPVPDRFRA